MALGLGSFATEKMALLQDVLVHRVDFLPHNQKHVRFRVLEESTFVGMFLVNLYTNPR